MSGGWVIGDPMLECGASSLAKLTDVTPSWTEGTGLVIVSRMSSGSCAGRGDHNTSLSLQLFLNIICLSGEANVNDMINTRVC